MTHRQPQSAPPDRSSTADLRVALVHDWLTGMRGGEKVLLELCRLFPSASVYALVWKRGSVHPEIESRIRQTSFLQRLPRATSAYRNYLPLFPTAIRSLSIRDTDLVISSNHAVAKGVRVPPGAIHVCYVHSPMRYLWDDSASYFQFGRGRSWKRGALALTAPYLRRFDVRTARAVDQFIANSETVRGRIERFYGAEATVIPPPVDTDFFRPVEPAVRGDEYLVVSSLEPYKRIDLAIEAFHKLRRPLLIAGSGTQERELRALAAKRSRSAGGGNVRFVGHVTDEQLLALYRNCRAVVFPGIEDFGIVPVEAQACGKPVVCCGSGGATESVIDGRTGIHFWPQQADALAAAVERAERVTWNPRTLREHSLQFSTGRFRDRMKAFLRSHLGPSVDSATRSDADRHRVHFA